MLKNGPFWLCQVEVVSVMSAMNVIEELTVDEQECLEHCDIGEEVTEHVEIVETSDSLSSEIYKGHGRHGCQFMGHNCGGSRDKILVSKDILV